MSWEHNMVNKNLIEKVCQDFSDSPSGKSLNHSANRPLLMAGKPETRSYKAVFFLGKAEIGQQSDVAQATARP
jgi:hypothetical protein